MSDLIIKGLSLPKVGRVVTLTIFHDGTIADKLGKVEELKAEELIPHGRLIDADEFKKYITSGFEKVKKDLHGEYRVIAEKTTESFCLDIDEAPTVLEASYSCENCHWFRPNPITWECCHEQGECNGERFEQAEP